MVNPVAPWNLVDHIPPDEVVVQGHRGVGELAEENTIEAFELAWSMQLWPEADLRMTRDGVIVPFHDHNFNRVVQDLPAELRDQGVEDVTFAELSRLDVGSWRGEHCRGHHVVPMQTIFERMRGRPSHNLYMDVKQVDFARLAEEVRGNGVERQVVLASCEVAHLRTWKSLVPEGETLLWVHGNEAEIRRDLALYRPDKFAGITQLQLHIYPKVTDDGWAPPTDPSPDDNPFRLRNDFLREVGDELRTHGLLYQAYVVTADASAYARLMDLGLMSFATDHPVDAWREIRRYYEQRRAATTLPPR
jgi:glycerophosphoryl diester phosphodiesterase